MAQSAAGTINEALSSARRTNIKQRRKQLLAPDVASLSINNNYPECIANPHNAGHKNKRTKAKTDIAQTDTNAPATVCATVPIHRKFADFPQVQEFKPLRMTAPKPEQLYSCKIAGYKVGTTTGKVYYKHLCCGKEWCPTCGHDYSISHQRRKMRIMPKLFTFDKCGYMVVTLPCELWPLYRDKKRLNKFRTYIKRKLQRGYHSSNRKPDGKKFVYYQVKHAVMRWHWCGDDGATFKPHLNILIGNLGFVQSVFLEQLRTDICVWLMREHKLNYMPQKNIYYAYISNCRTEKGKKKLRHWANYVTRPTAKVVHDGPTQKVIKGYRNTTFIGKFEKCDHNETSAAQSALIKNCDLETGELIVWNGYMKAEKFNKIRHTTTDLGAGIFVRVLDD